MSTVLIIDTEAAYRRVLTHVVTELGHTVTYTGDADQSKQIDLVIAAIPADGAEGVRRLCSSHHVPVIVTSTLGRDDERQAMLDAGAIDWIRKPFRPTRVGHLVESMLGVAA